MPASDFPDDFNRFLYYGQGRVIREYRESLGLQRREYAVHTGIEPGSLRAWESGQKRMAKKSWERYFQSILCI